MKMKEIASTPPSADEGELVLVKATGTGDFASKEDQVAIRRGTSWNFKPAKAGDKLVDSTTGKEWIYDGTRWFTIVAPFSERYYRSSAATAKGTEHAGIIATSTSNAAKWPSTNRNVLITQIDYRVKSGAGGGANVTPIFQATGANTIDATTIVIEGADTVARGSEEGDLFNPVLEAVGSDNADGWLRIGWRNEATSGDNLASDTFFVAMHGYYIEVM